ncbi:MAG: N-acetylglucosamine-6-phosphate deacetylase [Dokdonella sp.]|uniref:N-acetylglucosamine-6-phosphate deacetylase n=1 Tax=Dokdonella sp. TaxID=2291710 RepID=UPI0025BBE587|nr:N-acetylglucosamine-6-phosphate deacetylase [Dokdonella sp.]MBZ0221659.1 N-acetylglucosamine-6-phosphate deacetylase [Dokdonella sp.]MCC7255733.1 N-acetylglucosamine-6-phosphate deacetylase [Dokdonella sp.]
MSTALINARVLLDAGWRDDCAVLIEGARISTILAHDDPRVTAADHHHDLKGNVLVPGFIDVQVNGGGGVLFNDAPTLDSIRRIGAAHRRFGTTGFLPTLVSDEIDVMRAAIGAVQAAIDDGVPGVLGIHLEGPYIAAAKRGAHDAARFRLPDTEEFELVCSLRGGRTVLTLAPEQATPDLVRAFSARGVIVSLGHSNASYEQARAALDAGASGFTHLFNAMSALQGRSPGMVGAALEDAASWVGIIVDGHHVHPASLRVARAAKAHGKLILVTDAMPPVGADDGDFMLAGQRVITRNGRCENEQGSLAGSALDMAGALRNSIAWLGVDLDEATRMASTWPAQFLGLGATHGRIEAGWMADLVELDGDLQVQRSWIAGFASN